MCRVLVSGVARGLGKEGWPPSNEKEVGVRKTFRFAIKPIHCKVALKFSNWKRAYLYFQKGAPLLFEGCAQENSL